MWRREDAFERGLIAIGIALALVVVCYFGLSYTGLAKHYHVPTENMAPTIPADSHVYAVSYFGAEPTRGDIIVFSTKGIGGIHHYREAKSAETYCKRLIGLPGDTIEIRDGKVFIDGSEFLDHPNVEYLTLTTRGSDQPGNPCTVPAGHYFVLGDNPANSADSRIWGFVPTGNVTGKVVKIFR